MSAYAKKQLKQNEEVDADDGYKTKLDEALEQLDVLATENMHIKESLVNFEADCSEEDAPHIIT